MDYFCVNHVGEKAVGLCGTCRRPACYRCSLNVNQVVFCSLECFNDLNPPSAQDNPLAKEIPVAVPASVAALDEYSDVIASLEAPAVHPPLADEPSVILSAHHADATTMLGMSPVHGGGDGSTLILIPGTKRAVISSSCFFHPDTSAIVLCETCRNPICSLCAQETPTGGLTCSPSCGPLDPVGDQARRKFTAFNLALAAAVILVIGGAIVLFQASRQPDPVVALAPVRPVPAVADLPPSEPVPAVPEPTPVVIAKPEPEAVEPPPQPVTPPVTNQAPAPAKVEAPEPPPAPPKVVVEPPPATPVVAVAAPEPAKPALPAPTVEPSVKEIAAAPVEAPKPAPVAPAKPEPSKPVLSALDVDLRWAASLLREAAPLLDDVARAMDPAVSPDADVPALGAKLSAVAVKLQQARGIYLRRLKDVPDPAILQLRIDKISEVLDAVQSGFDRIRESGRRIGPARGRS